MLINPRLTDYYGVSRPQASLDFAIPFFKEDVPLYVDPLLLWKSPSQQDQALHTSLINAFNHLGALLHDSKEKEAVDILIAASECHEVGLGSSATRRGKRIGKEKAEQIVSLFRSVPKYETHGFRHFEEIQFFVDGISKDRISDITCSFIKSFLIDFTIDQCEQLGIPLSNVKLKHVYDYRRNTFSPEPCRLPINPESGDPIILVPKRWLTVHLIDQYAAYRLSELSSA